MSPLIEINDPAFAGKNTVLLDARGGPNAYQRYLDGHLENAVYIDLDKDLAAKPADAAIGGRHPLPDIHNFGELLGSLGVTPDTDVIVYDDKAGAMSAARLWWMLRSIGHKSVKVLNGGLQAAINAGISLATGDYKPTSVEPYPVPTGYSGTVDIDEAGAAAQSDDRLVIDVRENPRYLGQTEPIDLIAGHIPGAVNLPYIENLDSDGKYLSPETLREKYEALIGDVKPENVIVHCGSGVTACHTLLGMEHAGISEPKLYVGSWSEWSRRDLPIATDQR